MSRWFRKYRLLLGYVTVAVLSAVGYFTLVHFYPSWLNDLSAAGYELERPGFLWLIAGIPLLWLVRLHSLSDTPILQQLLSVTLRSALLLLLCIALTGVTHRTHEARKTATVVLVDVSESVPDSVLTSAHKFTQELFNKKEHNTVRLVTFAEEAKTVPLIPTEDGKLPSIGRHAKKQLGTNLQQAIRLAYGLFPPSHKKRMVVVSDGLETAGNALIEVQTAKQLGVEVSYMSYPKLPPKPELMVQSIDVPDDIEVNVPFQVVAHINSNTRDEAKCTLKIDKLISGVEKVRLAAGEQSVEFERVRVRRGGEHAFKVFCEPLEKTRDRFTTNNRYEVSRFVYEKPKLLYVEGEGLYSRNFRDALSDDFKVDVRGAAGIPRSLAAMKRYKGIVVSDVPRQTALYRENMTHRQMRMLHDYARSGGLLIFAGGANSFGPGGYTGTYLERKVLPVKLDVEHELESPRVAMVLVIDRSGSMSGRKLELAKKAARETARVLSRQDRLGIVAFDSRPMEIIRLTSAGSTRRFDRSLSRLTAGGGTNILQALHRGFNMLEAVDAQLKHIILLTDGQSNRGGILTLVEDASRKKITVSTIAIGTGSARGLLQSIADVGHGRHHYTDSAEAIPKLFVNETRKITREALVRSRIRPMLNRKYAGLRFLRGINVSAAPTLGGYVTTQAKPKAQNILMTPKGEPLLTRWKRGRGWVYVFTSDIKNKWGNRWIRWAGFAPFWRQLIKDGMPNVRRERQFPIELAAKRHTLTISTDAVDQNDQFIGKVSSHAVVTHPTGETQEFPLSQSAAGRNEVKISVRDYGPYSVDVVHKKNGRKIAISRGRIAYPYPEEHMRWKPDLMRLQSLAAATGGDVDPESAQLLSADGEEITRHAPVWHWPLYVVLAAFLADVLLRRVRLWPARTVSWLG